MLHTYILRYIQKNIRGCELALEVAVRKATTFTDREKYGPTNGSPLSLPTRPLTIWIRCWFYAIKLFEDYNSLNIYRDLFRYIIIMSWFILMDTFAISIFTLVSGFPLFKPNKLLVYHILWGNFSSWNLTKCL